MIPAPREYVSWSGSCPWPALRFPGDPEEDAESHICRSID